MQKIIISLTLLILFNCSKKDDSSNNNRETEIDLVTGVDFREDEFTTPLRLGNPNVFKKMNPNDIIETPTNNPDEGNPDVLSIIDYQFNEYAFELYPSPVVSQFNIVVYSNNISDIWIIPGKAEKIYQNTDFSTILNSNLYTESEVESKSVIQINNLNGGSTYSINAENLTGGYYKAFVKINGKLYWDNFYKQGNNFQYSEFESLINWWNN